MADAVWDQSGNIFVNMHGVHVTKHNTAEAVIRMGSSLTENSNVSPKRSRLTTGKATESCDSQLPCSVSLTCPQYSPSVDDSENHDYDQSIVDGLLSEIYDRWHYNRHDSFDSDTFTECSSTAEFTHGRRPSSFLEMGGRPHGFLHRANLQDYGFKQLKSLFSDMTRHVSHMSARLVRQLKRRERRMSKLRNNCDIVTAIIQASSPKRRIDTRMRFSVEPAAGDSAFEQWKDAMKAVARLPLGIPDEFRKKVWLSLAEQHIQDLKIDWDKTAKFAFNERSNPDDNKLGLQIVKDLHRTGCSGYSGEDSEAERAVLKRILLAYARWNKAVGYCQGFNVIAALLLDVMDRKESDALKVMIYLIDHVLPQGYFANNLRALSVDMAVFRDLLKIFPKLSRHLDYLQHAQDQSSGGCYEPPLTNVFTMQWFLTLFATCLPKSTVLRVWDSILLDGSEILLRTALVIWGKLSSRILTVSTADEFYTLMGDITQEMLEGNVLDADSIIKSIYSIAPFPLPQLTELREKYTYNIRPFTSSSKKSLAEGGGSVLPSDEDELEEEDIENITCFTGFIPTNVAGAAKHKGLEGDQRTGSFPDIASLGPGAYGMSPVDGSGMAGVPAYMERMCTDITALKKQYTKLRERQNQAHIIITSATARHHAAKITAMIPNIETPTAMNHLFVTKQDLKGRNRYIAAGPRIANMYPTLAPAALATRQKQSKGGKPVQPEGKCKWVQKSPSKTKIEKIKATQSTLQSPSVADKPSVVEQTIKVGIQETGYNQQDSVTTNVQTDLVSNSQTVTSEQEASICSNNEAINSRRETFVGGANSEQECDQVERKEADVATESVNQRSTGESNEQTSLYSNNGKVCDKMLSGDKGDCQGCVQDSGTDGALVQGREDLTQGHDKLTHGHGVLANPQDTLGQLDAAGSEGVFIGEMASSVEGAESDGGILLQRQASPSYHSDSGLGTTLNSPAVSSNEASPQHFCVKSTGDATQAGTLYRQTLNLCSEINKSWPMVECGNSGDMRDTETLPNNTDAKTDDTDSQTRNAAVNTAASGAIVSVVQTIAGSNPDATIVQQMCIDRGTISTSDTKTGKVSDSESSAIVGDDQTSEYCLTGPEKHLGCENSVYSADELGDHQACVDQRRSSSQGDVKLSQEAGDASSFRPGNDGTGSHSNQACLRIGSGSSKGSHTSLTRLGSNHSTASSDVVCETEGATTLPEVFSPDDASSVSPFQQYYINKRNLGADPAKVLESQLKKSHLPKKLFNPFPVKHVNQNRAKNGIKLGLYKQSTLEQFERNLKGHVVWGK